MLRQRLEKGGRRLSSAQLSPCLDHERARTMGRRERRQSRRRQQQSSPDSKIGEPASTIISSSLSQYRAAIFVRMIMKPTIIGAVADLVLRTRGEE